MPTRLEVARASPSAIWGGRRAGGAHQGAVLVVGGARRVPSRCTSLTEGGRCRGSHAGMRPPRAAASQCRRTGLQRAPRIAPADVTVAATRGPSETRTLPGSRRVTATRGAAAPAGAAPQIERALPERGAQRVVPHPEDAVGGDPLAPAQIADLEEDHRGVRVDRDRRGRRGARRPGGARSPSGPRLACRARRGAVRARCRAGRRRRPSRGQASRGPRAPRRRRPRGPRSRRARRPSRTTCASRRPGWGCRTRAGSPRRGGRRRPPSRSPPAACPRAGAPWSRGARPARR